MNLLIIERFKLETAPSDALPRLQQYHIIAMRVAKSR